MGNCSPKPKTRPVKQSPPASPVRIHGPESCPTTHRIRIALLYKSVPFDFVPTSVGGGPTCVQIGHDMVKGPIDFLIRHVDVRLGGAPVAAAAVEAVDAVKAAVELQHRSMERHVAAMGRWARGEDLSGAAAMAMAMGTTRRRRLGEWYGKWVEVMLEHAQMEERLLFPALDRAADYGVCRKAREEHGRDLPLMNGIKEDIKSVVVMEAGSPLYQEALINLSLRFKTLQERCKEHFAAEEKQLLPLLELAERTRREEGDEPWSQLRWAEQVMSLMEATHSHLFPFVMAGLLPGEAMQYVDLVCVCIPDDLRVVKMLRSLASWIEGTMPMSWIRTTPFPKSR